MPLVALSLLAWTHVGWSLFLRVALARGGDRIATLPRTDPGPVSVIVAAYAEETVIAETVRALRSQTIAAEIIVACDGSPDATAARAREAGADLVLELPRGGKHAAQAAAVARASGELLAFCDANTVWEPDALEALRDAFLSGEAGYACGHVEFVREDGGSNQEGAYWALELATRRAQESAWHSVTAGNGGIYAVRASLWPQLRTDLGHDLALPHQVVRAGYLALDVPGARANETMVPSLEGEWRRKRRMMARMWGIVLRDPRAGGLLDPRGLPPRYLLALVSHRWLRYASPLLHVVALVGGLRRVSADPRPNGGRSSALTLNRLALAAQLSVLAGAAAPAGGPAGGRFRARGRGVWASGAQEEHLRPTPTASLLAHLSLLRADDRLDRRGRLGPPALRPARGGLVAPGGHAVSDRPAAGAPREAAEDRHAELRARMRADGFLVGPDGPVNAASTGAPDALRRALDVLVSLAMLVVLALPLALACALVRLESPGGPIFRQRRSGLGGAEFEVVKLRTMVSGAERLGAGLAIDRGDARITRLGRFLRRTSIDELPQLVNILRGEMTLVGPRPTLPHQIAAYDARQRERLLVKPGVTGWAQIHGRTTPSWPERIELDRWYVANRSLRLDARILVRTVGVVFGGEGVEREGRAWVDPGD